jgi:hypothetical protein
MPRLRRSGRRLVPTALPWADLWLALRAEELLPPRPTHPMPSLRDSAIMLGERSRRLRAWLSNATAPPFGNTRECHRSAVSEYWRMPRLRRSGRRLVPTELPLSKVTAPPFRETGRGISPLDLCAKKKGPSKNGVFEEPTFCLIREVIVVG